MIKKILLSASLILMLLNMGISSGFAQEVPNAYVKVSSLNVRNGANIQSQIIGNVVTGQKLQVLEQSDKWSRVRLENGSEGWVYSDYISSSGGTYSQYGGSQVVSRGGSRSSSLMVVANAKLGAKYSRGAEGPGSFDCSGFVKYVYKEVFGKVLPHSSKSQSQLGSAVSREAVQTGDIVVFATAGSSSVNHSGIYMNDGKFIHASSYDGKVVISDMSSGHYYKAFRGARRLE